MLEDSTDLIRPCSTATPRCGASAMVTRLGGVGPMEDTGSRCT